MSRNPFSRVFYYKFAPETNDINGYRVDLRKDKTIFDLSTLISQKHNKQLIICGYREDWLLKNFNEYHTFIVQPPTNKVINIHFPKKTVSIEGYDTMTFEHVREFFGSEGFFYSQSCIDNNFHLFSNDKELPKSGFPFSKLPNNSDVKILMKGSYLNIRYNGKTFAFTNDELASSAINILKSQYGKIGQISILSSKGIDMEPKYHLNKEEKYSVQVWCLFVFIDYQNEKYHFLEMEYMTTALNAKIQLLDKIFAENPDRYELIDPKQIILFGCTCHSIHDNNIILSSVQSLNYPFYFFVSLIEKTKQSHPEKLSCLKPEDSSKSSLYPSLQTTDHSPTPYINYPVLFDLPEETDKNQINNPNGKSASFENSKETKKKFSAKPKKFFKPKITPIDNDDQNEPKNIKYEGQKKAKNTQITKLQNNESKTKESDIDIKKESEPFIDDKKENENENLNEEKIGIETIHVNSDDAVTGHEDESNIHEEAQTNKYNYLINTDKECGEILLGEEATVKDMKIIMAGENNINNFNNVKILYAGKELLDEIVLKKLEIGNTKLFVYIKSEEDILLMTAKALRYNEEYSEYTYDEEEED